MNIPEPNRHSSGLSKQSDIVPSKVYLEVTEDTDVEDLADRLMAALFDEPSRPPSRGGLDAPLSKNDA
jgi:di/tripeptidase